MTEKKKLSVFIILIILFVCTALAGVMLGSVGLSFAEMWGGITGDDDTARIILSQLRLPRVLAAILAGMGLSVSGYILQTVTDNNLSAPGIVGINSGAGFAAMALTCFIPLMWRFIPVAAFIGALLTSFIVLGISNAGGGKGKKTSIVLAGVAVSSMFSGGISFLSVKFPDALPSYIGFSVGGFSGVKTENLIIPAVIIIICFVLAMIIAPKIQLLCLGDEVAATLGISVRKIRIIGVILSAALAASVVSFAGLIGFVGLIVPHIARKLGVGTLRASLPVSALIGGILVMLSDLAGRTLFSPGEIPAGIFMAFIGAPFFLYLLLKGRKHG